MTVKQLSVFVENKPGKLATIIGYLAEAGIDLRAISIADTSDFGILRLIVDDPDKAVASLGEKGILVNATEVIAVKVPDKAGSLSELLNIFRSENIDIEYMYALFTRDAQNAFMVFRVGDIAHTEEVLKKSGYEAVSPAEVGIKYGE